MKKLHAIILLSCLSLFSKTLMANPSSGFCDSLSAFTTAFVASNPGGSSIDNFTNSLNWSFGYMYSGDPDYWHKKLDSCGITYPTLIVDCSILGSYMDSFSIKMPGYAIHCPTVALTSYLNFYCYPVIKAYNNSQNWQLALDWCDIGHPSTDSLHTRCDTLRALDSVFAACVNYKQDLSVLQNSYINTFNYYGYYDSLMVWHSADLDYWFGALSSCGIYCNNISPCSRIDSFMTLYKTQVPTYSSVAPSFTWLRFLSYYNVTNYGPDYIRPIVNCCNISTPAEDTLHTHCDSVAAAKIVADSWPSYSPDWQYKDRMNTLMWNWGHSYNDTLWVNNELETWLQEFSTCGLGCTNIINCHEIDSVLNVFYTTYPGTYDHCARFAWLSALNNFVGYRGGWYTEAEWVSMLSCCNIHMPAVDIVNSYCDSLGVVLNMYNQKYPNGSTWYEFNSILNMAGWQHFDPASGQMLKNSNQYYMTKLLDCGYSMPAHIVDCDVVSSIMQHYYETHPADTVHVFPYSWVYMLNTQNAGEDGTGHYSSYPPMIWEPILQGCHVRYPANDSLPTRCDSIAYVINTLKNNDDLSSIQWRLGDLFDYNHWDTTTNSSIPNTPEYWYGQIASCSLCSSIIPCDTVQALLDSFARQFPQYAVVCPRPVLAAYLSGDKSGGDADFWTMMASCCNIGLPRDTTMNSCDTAFVLTYQVFSAQRMLGGVCFPRWLINAVSTGNDFNWSGQRLLSQDSICGLNILNICNDTLITHCDSMRSVAYVYDIFFNLTHGQGGDMSPTPEDVYAALYGEYPEGSVVPQIIACDSNECLAINYTTSQTQLLFPTYSCVPKKIFTCVLNAITGLTYNYSQWSALYAHCGDTIPSLCDSVYSPCDSLVEAMGLAQRLMTVFQIADSTEAYQMAFGAYYGQEMDSTAIELVKQRCSVWDSFPCPSGLATSISVQVGNVIGISLGSIKVDMSGGVPPYKYVWYDVPLIADTIYTDTLGHYTIYDPATNPVHPGVDTGVYHVDVYDSLCLRYSLSIPVGMSTEWIYSVSVAPYQVTIGNMATATDTIVRRDTLNLWGSGIFLGNGPIVPGQDADMLVNHVLSDGSQLEEYAGITALDSSSMPPTGDVGNPSTYFGSVDHFFFYFKNGSYYIIDADGQSTALGSIQPSDEYRVNKRGNTVQYLVNNTVIKTKAITQTSATLLGGGSILTSNTYLQPLLIRY